MTSKFAAALAGAIILTTAAVRAADVPPDAQKAIAADYQLGCTAAINPTDSNLAAAFTFLSPDFVDIDVKGKKTPRDQVVAMGTQSMKLLHASACDPTTESSVLNADGTIAVVEDLHVVGSLQGTGWAASTRRDGEDAGHVDTGQGHVDAIAEPAAA